LQKIRGSSQKKIFIAAVLLLVNITATIRWAGSTDATASKSATRPSYMRSISTLSEGFTLTIPWHFSIQRKRNISTCASLIRVLHRVVWTNCSSKLSSIDRLKSDEKKPLKNQRLSLFWPDHMTDTALRLLARSFIHLNMRQPVYQDQTGLIPLQQQPPGSRQCLHRTASQATRIATAPRHIQWSR
jgi:hypothetical protein